MVEGLVGAPGKDTLSVTKLSDDGLKKQAKKKSIHVFHKKPKAISIKNLEKEGIHRKAI